MNNRNNINKYINMIKNMRIKSVYPSTQPNKLW